MSEVSQLVLVAMLVLPIGGGLGFGAFRVANFIFVRFLTRKTACALAGAVAMISGILIASVGEIAAVLGLAWLVGAGVPFFRLLASFKPKEER
jgi:hypothetical protein